MKGFFLKMGAIPAVSHHEAKKKAKKRQQLILYFKKHWCSYFFIKLHLQHIPHVSSAGRGCEGGDAYAEQRAASSARTQAALLKRSTLSHMSDINGFQIWVKKNISTPKQRLWLWQ
jgi:hypothetical protein